MAIALWKYFKRAAEVKTSLPSPIAVYIKQHFHVIQHVIQRVIDTINDGTLY